MMWPKVKEYARRKNFSEYSLSSASSIQASDEDTSQHQVNAFYALFCIILYYYYCLFVLEGGGGGFLGELCFCLYSLVIKNH